MSTETGTPLTAAARVKTCCRSLLPVRHWPQSAASAAGAVATPTAARPPAPSARTESAEPATLLTDRRLRTMRMPLVPRAVQTV